MNAVASAWHRTAGAPTRLGWQGRIAAGRVALAAVIFAAWSAAAAIAGRLYVAPPWDVAWRIVADVDSGHLAPHVLATLRVSFLGFAMGWLMGVLLPLLLLPRPRTLAVVEHIAAASAMIPKYALIPLLILWVGIDDGPKLWLIALLVFYPTLIGTLAGARHLDRSLMDIARVFGASHLTAARLVIWPAALPFVCAGLRISVPRALGGAIVAEFLVGNEGIGYLIEFSRQSIDTVGVFAGIVIASMLIWAPAAFLRRLQYHVTWPQRGAAAGDDL
jgi:NitT/TauT family transport system permease protein